MVFAAGLVFWLGSTSLCMGGGRDSALQRAFKEVFPEVTGVKELTPKSPFSRVPRVLEMRDSENLLGYVVELKVVSRSGPFLIQVAVSAEETVLDVQIPKYPHQRGRGVKKTTFLDQFNGVAYGEQLILGEGVDGVSGATSSSSAVTTGVRQALVLVHRYRSDDGG
ncbi:MAG TPA: FMN-binding protein [Pontiella sp.]|nr:FMN-binding protein [Pontiella sp.]